MPEPYDLEVVTLTIPRPATVPPGTVTEPEWTALDARVTGLESGQNLNALTDVDTTGVTDGDSLIYDGGDPVTPWKPGTSVSGLPEIEDGGVVVNTVPVTNLWPNIGLAAVETVPGQVAVSVIFAGTGAENTASRSDHEHSAAVFGIDTGVATGVLSSGTRVLASTNTAALANGITYDVKGTAFVRARNNINSGTCNLLFRVGASGTYPQRSRNVQTVGGVPVDQIIHFTAVLVGTGAGAAVTFSVQFSSGDPVDLRDHEIVVACHPRK